MIHCENALSYETITDQALKLETEFFCFFTRSHFPRDLHTKLIIFADCTTLTIFIDSEGPNFVFKSTKKDFCFYRDDLTAGNILFPFLPH